MMERVSGAWGRSGRHCEWLVLEEVPKGNLTLPVIWGVVSCGHQRFPVKWAGNRLSRTHLGMGRGQGESLSWQRCRQRLAEGCFP